MSDTAQALSDSIHLKERAFPKSPDLRYDWQVTAKTEVDKSADAQHGILWKGLQKVDDEKKFLKVFKLDSFAVRTPYIDASNLN